MRQNSRVRDISLMALFSALTAIGAFITIPIPPVPFTLQIFFAILAGALLGSKRGFISVGVYVLLGLCGLPVFTKGAGLSYIFQPTFGYLAGFILGAWVCGKVIELRKDYSFKTMLLGCFAGAGTDFAIGAVFYLPHLHPGRCCPDGSGSIPWQAPYPYFKTRTTYFMILLLH